MLDNIEFTVTSETVNVEPREFDKTYTIEECKGITWLNLETGEEFFVPFKDQVLT